MAILITLAIWAVGSYLTFMVLHHRFGWTAYDHADQLLMVAGAWFISLPLWFLGWAFYKTVCPVIVVLHTSFAKLLTKDK